MGGMERQKDEWRDGNVSENARSFWGKPLVSCIAYRWSAHTSHQKEGLSSCRGTGGMVSQCWVGEQAEEEGRKVPTWRNW